MALNLNEKKIPFGGQLGGTGLLIILLVVSLVLVVVYSREGDEGALHSLQNTTSAVSSPLSSAGTAAGSLADSLIPAFFIRRFSFVGRPYGRWSNHESAEGKQRAAFPNGGRA